MIDGYWKAYAKICEKQIEKMNIYIGLILKEKHKAQAEFFIYGMIFGSGIFLLVFMIAENVK